jgi:UDP-hydrolysing UDP-N-acetyl-D-glucosamine 2-epimerase
MIYYSSRADKYLLQPIAEGLKDVMITDEDYPSLDSGNLKYCVVLGDRYETCQHALSCFYLGIPIIHIEGGESTPNSKDDIYRDCITRMASLHFVATSDSIAKVRRINPSAVALFVGSIGAELAQKTILTGRGGLESAGYRFGERTWLVTFHPQESEDVQELIGALKEEGGEVIWTYPNRDPGREEIIEKVKAAGFQFYEELGLQTYFSIAKQCTAVVGNSSSGIIEIPVLGVPVVNVGKRQEGRPQAKQITNCLCKKDNILHAFLEAQANPARGYCLYSPYRQGDTIQMIIDGIKAIYG